MLLPALVFRVAGGGVRLNAPTVIGVQTGRYATMPGPRGDVPLT
jgi:hypothetical protein